MRNLVRGAIRAVALIVLAGGSLDVAVWLLDGNDPAADADIGIGLVPLGVIAVVPAAWAFLDARRHTTPVLRMSWGTAALAVGVVAMMRSLESVDDATFALLFVTACIAVSAWIGVALRGAWRTPRRIARPDA